MSELRYPTWQEPVRLALLEFHPEKRAAAYSTAFAAIHGRQLALAGLPNHREERVALQDAINTLNIASSTCSHPPPTDCNRNGNGDVA